MAEEFIGRNGLAMQISVLACRAVESSDPLAFLKDMLPYHNVSEYYVHEKGPLRFLMLLSDNSVALPGENGQAMEPTAYLAVANRVLSSEYITGFSDAPLANFFVGQSPCSFELAEGAMGQALVIELIASLPMQSLFSLLGQGYKIVLSGNQLGGQVAHTMAAKLLLQVHQEIKLAESMGINLSALSMTADKVLSFAFCSPLFANLKVHEALAAISLESNLITIWKPKDGCPAFYTMCCNLASASSSEPVSAGPPILPHLSTDAFKAAQAWTKALQAELLQLPRHNRLFSAMPLVEAEVRKLLNPMVRTSADQPRSSGSSASQAPGDGVSSSGSPQAGSAGMRGMSKSFSDSAGASSQLGKSAVLRAVRNNPIPALARLSSKATPARPDKATAASEEHAADLGQQAVHSLATWQGCVKELHRIHAALPKEGAPRLYPVGQFWLLETGTAAPGVGTAPKKSSSTTKALGKAAPAAAAEGTANAVDLVSLSAADAAGTSLAWLSTSNKELFDKWEYGLDELQRDMIEAFAWTTFKTTREVDGRVTDRKTVMALATMEIC